jgi:hypothetical protein
VTGQWWFSPVSSTQKTDRHDITEILLKVALSTIKPNQGISYDFDQKKYMFCKLVNSFKIMK